MGVILTALGVADDPETFVTRPVERLALTWGGIENDRHFGLTAKAGVRQKHHPAGTEIRNARQLSIVSEEELAEIAGTLKVPRMAFGWLGANLCLSGLPRLTQLLPSTRLKFPSGACVVIDGENKPCSGPGKKAQRALGAPVEVVAQFVKAAHQRRGVVAWVERPGVIATGDVIEVIG